MSAIYAALVEQVRNKKPLVHHITNYVTVNDCANITLAIGASPIMADAVDEAADIASIASAVVLNIGTLNERTIPAMITAGKVANQGGVPVVFDPVGAGASQLRNQTAACLLAETEIDVLCGNISEIRFLAGLQATTKGVDASDNDLYATDDAEVVATTLATRLDCVVAITGAMDVVSDGKAVVCIANGHPMMANLTGTGCMCSSLIGSFCGAAPDALFEATVAALLTMSIAGEIAYDKVGQEGNGSFRVALHDAVSRIDAGILLERARIHRT